MTNSNKGIFVTKPSLPPLEEYIEYLKQIWDSKQLTNNGPFHQKLEKEMADFLGVKYISLFANGTLALLTALQVLEIKGEVITTPYSFVATTNALWWNNIKPVFIDIEPDFCNLDPNKIEAAITKNTTAILPVHVYGNPCYVDRIQEIADNFGLKVIYDAAHAFGVKLNGMSVLNYGDLSVLSFHATKPYTTMEGGAVVCHDEETKKRIDYLKNFGFTGETTVVAPGINSKMNEMQAALGIVQLKYYQDFILKRKEISNIYKSELKNIGGISYLKENANVDNLNYSYFPIFVNEKKYGKRRDTLYFSLQENGINGRRYFYPLISDFLPYRGLFSEKKRNIFIAKEKSEKVICLPIYPGLDKTTIEMIIELIK